MANVGKNIRILRTRKKMTQDALAEKLFVSHQTVSNYETGKTRSDIDTLVKIADIMEVDVNVLIHGMPSQENTRNARIRSTALLAATVIFGFLLFSFSDYMNLLRQHTMRSAPYYLTLSLAFPAYYLLAGWVAMHTSDVFFHIRLFHGKFIPRIHFLLIVLICSWYIFLLPECMVLLADYLGIIRRTRFFGIESAWDFIASKLFAVVTHQKTPFFFLPMGIALWITKPRKSGSRNHTADIS